MKFCTICENMLYMRLVDDKLEMYCKSCGYTKDAEDETQTMDTNYTDDRASYAHFLTKNIEHDMSLPRVSNIPCPLQGCTKPAQNANEVIYIKYDPVNLRFIYFCCHCKRFWKTGGISIEA